MLRAITNVKKIPIVYPPPYPTNGTEVKYFYDKDLKDLLSTTKGYPDVEEIDEFFNQINKHTCLNFTRSEEIKENKIGIYFMITSYTDHVELSNDENKVTKVSLTRETYKDIFQIRFYIGLAFGLIPEIQRIDRDRELQIYDTNINARFKPYFNMSNYYYKFLKNTDYDFASATHFPNYFGSTGSGITYKPCDYRYEEMLKANKHFVYSDFRKINNIYCKCPKKNSCQHGGYYSKKDCNTCKCPAMFNGDNCEKLIETKIEGCNEGQTTLTALDDEQEVTIENIKEDCYISITATNSSKVVQIIVEWAQIFNIKGCVMNPRGEIKYRKDKGVEGLYIQHNVSESFELKALSSEVFVKFHDPFSKSSLVFFYRQVDQTEDFPDLTKTCKEKNTEL
uniref:Metalloendopeptidase n=1 Tax=Strongyloides papillosus TaxID=174720 RepID=A0A0N5BIH6_STREA